MSDVQAVQAGFVALAKSEAGGAAEEANRAAAFVRGALAGATYAQKGEMGRAVKSRWAELDALRKRWTAPLNSVVKDINDFFRPALRGLEALEGEIKSAMADDVRREETARMATLVAAGDAARAGDSAGAADLVALAAASAAPKAEGVAVRRTWTGEVVDAALIPREYLVPDLARLLAVTRAASGDPGIPGWRAWEDLNIAMSKGG